MDVKKEWILLVISLVVYSLFSHWIGISEYSRLLISISLVKENTFRIPLIYDPIVDLFYYKSKIFSDKEPGIAFLSSWALLLPLHLNNDGLYFVNTDPWEEKTSLNNFERELLLISTLTIVVISSLSVLLFYKISNFYFSQKTSFFLSMFFAFGTLYFLYATIFNEFSVATFFTLIGLRILSDRKYDKKLFLLSFLLAFSLLFSLLMVPIILSFLVYLYIHKKIKREIFVGFALGLIPILVYNYVTCDSLFMFPHFHSLFAEEVRKIPVTYQTFVYSFIERSFSPTRGIFFYYPVLLVSLILIVVFKKKIKNKNLKKISVLLTFFSFLYFFYPTQTYLYFDGKEFVPTIPIWILPLGYLIEDKRLRPFIIVLVLYSFFVTISGFSFRKDFSQVVSDKNIDNNELVNYNSLFTWYFRNLLERGPRTKILECLTQLRMPDIRINHGC